MTGERVESADAPAPPPRNVLVAALLAATAPLALPPRLAPPVLAATPTQPVAVPNAGFETAGAAGPALGLVARRPGPGRGRRAPRGRRPRRRRGDRARRGRAGVAERAVGEGGPPGRPRLPPLRLGEDARTPPPTLSRATPPRCAATLSMASFPFTNHSPAVGGTRDWTRVETTFVATAAADRVRLDLGRNGTATGRAWFDDVDARRGRRHHRGHPPRARALGGAGLPLRGPRLDLRPRGGRALRPRPPVREAGLRRDRRLHPEAVDPARREGPRPRLGRPAHAGRRAHAAPVRPRVPRGDEGHRRRRGRGGGRGPRAQGGPPGRRHDELRDRPRLDGGRSPGDAERRHRPDASSRPRTSSPCPTASTSARRSPRPGPPPPTAGPSSSRSSCGTATPASTSTWSSTSCPRRATASSCRPSPAASTRAPTST